MSKDTLVTTEETPDTFREIILVDIDRNRLNLPLMQPAHDDLEPYVTFRNRLFVLDEGFLDLPKSPFLVYNEVNCIQCGAFGVKDGQVVDFDDFPVNVLEAIGMPNAVKPKVDQELEQLRLELSILRQALTRFQIWLRREDLVFGSVPQTEVNQACRKVLGAVAVKGQEEGLF